MRGRGHSQRDRIILTRRTQILEAGIPEFKPGLCSVPSMGLVSLSLYLQLLVGKTGLWECLECLPIVRIN